jgi:hypothetical protein
MLTVEREREMGKGKFTFKGREKRELLRSVEHPPCI